jgi:hypothetical protein
MKLTLALVIALGVLGSQVVSAQVRQPAIASIIGAPFSGVRSQQAAKSFIDGNRIDSGGNVRLYRDGRGRTRVERELPSDVAARNPRRGAVEITINDPVSGDRYELNPQSKTCIVFKGGAARAYPLGSDVPGVSIVFARHFYGAEDPGWSAPVSLGEKSFDGLRAVGTRRQYTIPVGEYGNEKPIVLTVEQWFVPELGLVVARSGRASLGGEFSNQVENIVKGEPDPSLFTIPSDYTRVEAGHRAAAG